MKHVELQVSNAPRVFAYLAENEAELVKLASGHHAKNHTGVMTEYLDRTDDEEDEIVGLTIGTGEPAIHVYISGSTAPELFKETIVHESVHAANCIMRWRVHGSMERKLMLIISDKREISIPHFESIKVAVEGVNEEDQALLVSRLSTNMEAAFEELRK